MRSTWYQSKKQESLRSRVLASFSLLLLMMLLQLESIPCYGAVLYEKSSRFKGGSASGISAFKSQGRFKVKNNAAKDDEIFGAGKRSVFTGPNPLHNR
ncbi:hypothetical protein SLEP1_g27842 [Rubroshorea leprosula]|uniref:Clavata3/ESR (CLE) gene family member n=1 Tax=Rubroshorea leprosula TaxID=152421 RepID=A0AAV5K125_9ROSI|nr:hypothetical protein SLEP1_g27842 [Rubroshorea leprosula]